MTESAPGVEQIERFRASIMRSVGLHFDESKLAFLGEILLRRLAALECRCDAYLARLESEPGGAEEGELARELTVGETYFFRHIQQLLAFSEVALRERIKARSCCKRLSILSAGCASGEEAYSIAILLRQEAALANWDIAITGLDLNPAAIEKAGRACYTPWALRETSDEMKARWFCQQGRNFELDASLRKSVRFHRANLIRDDLNATYDVIFCRNVLMYMSPENARAALHRLTRSLAPGGYLFLGHAETVRGLSQQFKLCNTHETFYYQLAGTVPAETVRVPESAEEPSDLWVEEIGRASERIRQLSCPVAPTSPTFDLVSVYALIGQELYQQALSELQALPLESHTVPDVLLIRSALLAHSGQLSLAEEACRQLLEIDHSTAGAHYILALCREGAGDSRAAVSHDQMAAYLDPEFAMPRLHLGLLARRRKDCQTARKELSFALNLLEREPDERLLLFGGGFSRQALMALCRSELTACGPGK